MGLGSVMQTALSGISAAELVVAVAANNSANAQTVGFKVSRLAAATQPPQTRSFGAVASVSSGGSNPIQIGSGVQPAGIVVSDAQGAIAVGSNPLSVALQGEGMFILEGSSGERLYTRDGRFGLNAAGELVSSGGKRVMGVGVDEDSRFERGRLTSLKIPAGKQAQAADGSAATMVGFSIGSDGLIVGNFTDGTTRALGQIQVARFANPSGLAQRGGNTFAAGPNSGPLVQTTPGEAGTGGLLAGGTELSNVDLGQELKGLSQASSALSANLSVIDTADAMLDELTNLARWD